MLPESHPAAPRATRREMLIATRALLGVAIGIWITSYSVGAAIGPFLGGLMLQHFWWGSVFLLGVPVMVLLLVLGPVLLPEFRDPQAGRLDLNSAAMSLAAVLLVIYGLKLIAQDGLAWLPALSIVAGLAVGAGFLRRQRMLASPLIDLRLFRIPALSASLSTYLLATFVAFGAYIFIGQYLQLVLGLSPLEAGLWTLPWAGAFIVGSNLTPQIVRRFPPIAVIAGGLVLAAVGFGVLTQVGGTSGLGILITGSVIYSLGLAPVFTLTNDLILSNAPPERAGSASAISETSSELGGALGIAILGSIGTAVYRGQVAAAIPDGVPPAAAEAARSTLGGALAVVERLPNHAGAELLGTAREAFVQAMELIAGISAAVVILTAIIAVAVLGHSRPATGSPVETGLAPEA